MRKHIWFGLALAAAVLLPTVQASAQWTTVAPADAGFSVVFPGPAEFKRLPPKPKVDTRVWVNNKSKLFVIVGVTDYDARINAERELELDVKNFVASDGGSLKSQKPLTFSNAPDGPLPAVYFTFTDAAGSGESLVIVSGDRAYQVVVRAENGYDGKADTARIINSFRITQPSRHWQGD